MNAHKWIAEQRFRCIAPDGANFDLTIRLGEPVTVESEEVGRFSHGRCWLSMEPLAKDRWAAGNNQFQAICLALDYVRTVFKVFLAEGGRIYWEDTNSPIDIASPWFAPFPAPESLGLVGSNRAV